MDENKSNNEEEVIADDEPLELIDQETGNGNKDRRRKLFIGLIVILVIVFIALRNSGQQTPFEPSLGEVGLGEEESNSNLADYPDFAALENLKSVILASQFESWTPNSTLDPTKNRTIRVTQIGEISRAYLYVKAKVADRKLSKFESFYFKIDSVGGHLFRPNSLATPDSQSTELLFPLEKVSYLPSIPYDETRVPVEVNMSNYFGDGRQINIFSFISSLKPAEIEELSIYYECVEDSNCLLDI